jgi:hypothetical protein
MSAFCSVFRKSAVRIALIPGAAWLAKIKVGPEHDPLGKAVLCHLRSTNNAPLRNRERNVKRLDIDMDIGMWMERWSSVSIDSKYGNPACMTYRRSRTPLRAPNASARSTVGPAARGTLVCNGLR